MNGRGRTAESLIEVAGDVQRNKKVKSAAVFRRRYPDKGPKDEKGGGKLVTSLAETGGACAGKLKQKRERRSGVPVKKGLGNGEKLAAKGCEELKRIMKRARRRRRWGRSGT